MKALIPIGCCVAVVLAAAGGGAVASASTTTCTAGLKTVGGATVRTFCGPAKATVKIGGKTLRFRHGKCEKVLYAVNIGSVTLTGAKPKYRYFMLTTTKKRGGTYKISGDVALMWETPGKRYSLGKGSVKISNSMKSGTFSGTTVQGSQKASGSWRC